MNKLTDYLQQEGVLVLDGAMGTQLFAADWFPAAALKNGMSPIRSGCRTYTRRTWRPVRRLF